MKSKTATKEKYICQQCQTISMQWQGQCQTCQEWNTIIPYQQPQISPRGYAGIADDTIYNLAEINLDHTTKTISTGLSQLDRVLGQGLIPGSVILLGGQPGAGKSTLLLQILGTLSHHHNVLYVTGEESLQQVAARAHRLGFRNSSLKLMTETRIEVICQIAIKQQWSIIAIDSIQVMQTTDISAAPGSVAQVRACASQLVQLAKQQNIIILLIGHVTKEGQLAGPKVLEHMIDCSLLLECNEDPRYRTLRTHKNRFGTVNEFALFAMHNKGLKEINNPSALFLTGHTTAVSGTLVTVLWEGSQPVLVEIQALIDTTPASHPKRLSVGIESNRLILLLATLHRHGKIAVGNLDVFINVVGGIKISETSADLAILLSIFSSLNDLTIPADWVVFGEVGLTGEIRPVTNGQSRLQAAAKHGFRYAIVPTGNKPKKIEQSIEIFPVSELSEALNVLQQAGVQPI